MFAGSDMVELSQSSFNKFMSDDAAGGVIWIGGDRSQTPTAERESANSKFHNQSTTDIGSISIGNWQVLQDDVKAMS